MKVFVDNFFLAFPLFFIVGAGYFVTKVGLLTPSLGAGLAKFSFTITLPCLLFRLMSGIAKQSAPDWKVAVAFFGSCLIVFLVGNVIASRWFKLNVEGKTIFGIAGVFSNNVQLGVPLAVELLGLEAMPSVTLIFSINTFLMWTFATVVIELSRAQNASVLKTIIEGIVRTVKNPIVAAVILGGIWAMTGLNMPIPLSKGIDLLANAASPVALFSVGIGLTQYSIKSDLIKSGTITVLKLVLQPVIVFSLCFLLNLGPEETKAACLMACLPVGVNVYIMAQEFGALQSSAANALLITTFLSMITLPMTLTLFGLL